MTFYMLIDKKVIKCNDVQQWRAWRSRLIDSQDNTVGETVVGETRISTTFLLGIDHSYSDDGPPMLFETMTFGGMFDGYQWRWPSYEAAERGHERIVKELQEAEMQLDKLYERAQERIRQTKPRVVRTS